MSLRDDLKGIKTSAEALKRLDSLLSKKERAYLKNEIELYEEDIDFAYEVLSNETKRPTFFMEAEAREKRWVNDLKSRSRAFLAFELEGLGVHQDLNLSIIFDLPIPLLLAWNKFRYFFYVSPNPAVKKIITNSPKRSNIVNFDFIDLLMSPKMHSWCRQDAASFLASAFIEDEVNILEEKLVIFNNFHEDIILSPITYGRIIRMEEDLIKQVRVAYNLEYFPEEWIKDIIQKSAKPGIIGVS